MNILEFVNMCALAVDLGNQVADCEASRGIELSCLHRRREVVRATASVNVVVRGWVNWV